MKNPFSVSDVSASAIAQPSSLDARLAGIVANLPDALLCVDRSWHITYANAEATRISRLTPELSRDHTLWELFPDMGSEPNRRYQRAMETGHADHLELFYARFAIWVDIHILPTDEGLALYYQDITARRQSELREQATARRLSEVLAVTSDAVFSFDRAWHITFMNRNAEALVGRRDLLGKNLWEEFPAARTSPIWDHYHRAMEEGVASHFETYYPEPLHAWVAVQTQPSPDGIVVFCRDITAQRNREQALDEQQELLAVVQHAARVATWELDLSSGIITYGPGSFAVFGQPLSSLTNVTALERILLPGHAEKIRRSVEEAEQTGSNVVLEFAVTAADKSTLWIELRGQAIAHADATRRMRGMAIDITERKLDEAHLVASEARYRVLTDLSPQAIWMGEAGRITYANQYFLNYIGLTLDKLDETGWLAAFHPADRERVTEVWMQSISTGVEYEIEALICNRPVNAYRYWHIRAAPVRNSSGAILYWLGVAYDIHENKTAAAALHAEQVETERRRAELETLYKTTPVGHALLDPVNFTYLNLNDREAEMLGLPKEQIIGRAGTELALLSGTPEMLEILRSVAGGQVVKDHLLEGKSAAGSGELRAWRTNYAPIFKEDGSIRAISTASIEITSQRRAEAALVQSEKLAAVGRLASSISHEINNPLEAITNLLYLIALDQTLSPELRGYVQTTQSELARVSQIATQTLRFHRQSVAPTQVTAAELVDAVLLLYTGRLMNSHIEVDARYNTGLHILCFENDIRQVLNNLIANAIDAMRTGGRLIIRAHEVGKGAHEVGRGGDGIRITVADTGHGMSAAVLAHAFEPFYTTKDLNGTGLGLWISAGIIARHNGRLRVRSSEDPRHHGTVFSVYLPREDHTAH